MPGIQACGMTKCSRQRKLASLFMQAQLVNIAMPHDSQPFQASTFSQLLS